ncbi:MAG: hypothetical protein ABEJ68_10140 [Halobacteriaceae archaeon]
MYKRVVVAGVILAALGLGLVGANAVKGAFFLGPEVRGGLVLLLVGVALPQHYLYRRDGDPTRLGLVALIGGASVLIVGWGGVHTYLTHERFTLPLMGLFAILLVGVFLGTAVRELFRGYRSAV